MSAQNEIKIVFKGDDKLSDKIKKLDNATKKLLNTQAKIRDFNERIVKSNNKNKNSLKKLRIQLQLQGKEFKNLNIPLKMYKDALSGNDLALAKINQATKKYIANLKKQRNAQAKLVKHSEKNAVAIRKLRVKLLALGSDFDKAGISQSTLTRAMKGSQVAMEQLRNATRKFISTQGQATNAVEKTSKGLFGLGHSARNGTAELGGMGGAFSVLRSKLLLFNFAMGLGIRQVGKLVAEASKVNAMRTAFATLSGASDGLTISLKKITEATNGTMSEFNLFQQANNAMILGVTKNSDEMAEMFDIAQRLGKALGRDTASSVESLVTGIGRQSRLMLDNIGIIVKSEEAYEAYAEELGKTADNLSDAEKKQAFLRATMESAREKVRQLGEESLTTRDKIDQFTVSSANLSVAIGELLSPEFGNLAQESAKVLKNLTELTKIMSHTKGEALLYFETLEQTPDIIKKYSEAHNIAVDETKSLEFQLQQLMESLSEDVAKESLFDGNKTKNALARVEDAYENLITVTDNFIISQKEAELKLFESVRLDTAKKVSDEILEIQKRLKKELELFEEQKVDTAKKVAEEIKEAQKILNKELEFFDEVRVNTAKEVAREIKETQESLNSELKFFESDKVATAKKASEELKAIEKEIADDTKQLVKEKEDVRKAVFGDTTQFQLEQLNILEAKFLEHYEHTLESEKFFAEERKKIAKKTAEEITKLSVEKQKIKDLNMLAGCINALGVAFDVLADSQASASAKMSAFLRMAGGLLSVLGGTTPTGAFGGVLSAIGGAIGHTGGYIKQNGSIQRFAKGGMVLGQDKVPIMAQAGEFIMRKSAVDEIGVNTLAKLNKGETEVGNTVNTININIDGNIVGNEEFVRESLIPEIERTVQKGLA